MKKQKAELKRIIAFVLAAVMLLTLVTFDSDIITDAKSDNKGNNTATTSDADNSLSLSSLQLAADTEDPKISGVTVEDLTGSTEAFQTDDKLVVLKNGGGVAVTVAATDDTGVSKIECYKDSNVDPYSTVTVSPTSTSTSQTFELKDAGTYTFKAYDEAEKSVTATDNVKVDILAEPNVEVSHTNSATYLEKRLNTYGLIINTSGFKINVTASSKTINGVDVSKYVNAKLCYSLAGSTVTKMDMTYDSNAGTWSKSYEVGTNSSRKVLVIYVEDLFDNRSDVYKTSNNLIFVDNDAPVITINNVHLDNESKTKSGYDELSESEKWAKEVKIDATVTENNSYIESITYAIDGGTETTIISNVENYSYTISTLTLSSTGLSSGEHTVALKATNYLDLTTTSELKFYVDNEAPTISVESDSYDCNVDSIEDDNYYNKYYIVGDDSETLTISAVDTASGVASVAISLDGDSQTIAANTDGSYTLEINGQGYHTVVVTATDKVGNYIMKTIDLVIDSSDIEQTTTVTVTYNDSTTETYTNSSIPEMIILGSNVASINVTYKASGFGIVEASTSSVIYYASGSADPTNSEPYNKATDTSGNITTVTLGYTMTTSGDEGKYVVNFGAAKTINTNIASVSQNVTFVYDKTAPTITKASFKDASGSYDESDGTPVYVYKSGNTPTIEITCTDAYSIDSYEITDASGNVLKTGTVTKTSEADGVVTYSGSVGLENYSENQIYTVVINFTDKSGNTGTITSGDKNSKGEIILGKFVVDTTKPTVTISDVSYYNASSVSLKFTATDNICCKGSTIYYRVNNGSYQSLSTTASDGKTITASIPFKEEGTYEVSIRISDLAGNTSSWVTKKFIIDKTGAEVTITGIPENRRTQGTDVNIQLDDNFAMSADDYTLIMHCLTVDGDRTDTVISFSRSSSKTLVANASCYEKSGKACYYWFTITGTDKSGNKIQGTTNGTYISTGFYVDDTDPVVTISPVPSATNGGYYNTGISFKVNVVEQYDKLAGKVVITDANASVNGDETDTRTASSANATYTVSRSTQGIYNLTITATDAFGNSTSKNVSFVIDKEKPVITLGAVKSNNTTNVTLPVTLTDKYRGYSYVIHVTRKDASGNVVYDADYDAGTWNSTSKSLSPTFTTDGDYTVTVTATDKAGNEAVAQTATFRIDKTAPVLSITGVNDTQTSGCTATMSIDEAFSFTYDGTTSTANVTITKRTDGSAESTIATMDLGDFSSSNPHTTSYSFSEDGEYTITMTATDACGNTAAQVSKTFKVDSTAPVIAAATRDRNDISVDSYATVGSAEGEEVNYVIMDVDVTETFYSSNDVTFTVMKDGEDVSSSYFGAYANRSELSSVEQKFEEDGVYTVSITAKDALGNEAESYSIVFTLDNTAPTVNSTTVQANFRNKADDNGDILLNAADFDDIREMGYEALWTVNDTSIFTVECLMDGVELVDFTDLEDGYHKIVITVTDEVGHVTEKEFEFTYDGTAPRILITGVDDGATVNEEFTLRISLENSEDTITSIIINGTEIDPILYQETNTYEMQVTEYDDYIIQVEATDLAGNTASTFDETTGEYFSFTFGEKMSPVVIIIIIIAVLLIAALIVFLVLKNKKKKD